jgi:heme/copper-type cytochrome/quinol oxidase subunit 2
LEPRLKIMPCIAALLSVAVASCFSNSFAAREVAAPVVARQTAPAQQPAATPVVIHITAQKSRYDPSSFHVKSGSNVQLHISALDRAHGFVINAYPDKAATPEPPGLVFSHPQKCWKIEKGQDVVIEFVARQPGTYAFQCCVFCGFGHLGMKGEIIVDP